MVSKVEDLIKTVGESVHTSRGSDPFVVPVKWEMRAGVRLSSALHGSSCPPCNSIFEEDSRSSGISTVSHYYFIHSCFQPADSFVSLHVGWIQLSHTSCHLQPLLYFPCDSQRERFPRPTPKAGESSCASWGIYAKKSTAEQIIIPLPHLNRWGDNECSEVHYRETGMGMSSRGGGGRWMEQRSMCSMEKELNKEREMHEIWLRRAMKGMRGSRRRREGASEGEMNGEQQGL